MTSTPPTPTTRDPAPLTRARRFALLAVAIACMAAGLFVWQRVIRPADGADAAAVEYHVDVNAADSAELQLLPGVGPTLAQAIIDDRRRRGPFRSADDLMRVRGIARTLADGMKPYIRFGGEVR